VEHPFPRLFTVEEANALLPKLKELLADVSVHRDAQAAQLVDLLEERLRVDDHPDPVAELRRLWDRYQTDLAPVMGMLPTKAYPAGTFDLAALRRHLPTDD